MAVNIDHVPCEDATLAEYVPPRLERLGTLAELTQGGGTGPDDGYGGAGDEGSLG